MSAQIYGNWRYDERRGRWIAFDPSSEALDYRDRLYQGRSKHVVGMTPQDGLSRSLTPEQNLTVVEEGKQRLLYAKYPYGTSRWQFVHLYLLPFLQRPRMDVQRTLYAPSTKTMAAVPLSAQGKANRTPGWLRTLHGFPLGFGFPTYPAIGG